MKSDGEVRQVGGGFEWEIPGKGTGVVLWDDIQGFDVFKVDLVTTDMICINLELKSGNSFSLTEEMGGFDGFVKAISHEWLLGDEWFRRVALPPFKPCERFIKPPPKNNNGLTH